MKKHVKEVFTSTLAQKLCLLVLAGIMSLNIQRAHSQDKLSALITNETMSIDGKANEAIWSNVPWYTIDQMWVGSSYPSATDYSGKYKVCWNQNYLYVLCEITDNTLIDSHIDPLQNYWDDDCVEIFLDENRSKGSIVNNYNGWAYHISLTKDVVAGSTNGNATLYNDHILMEKTNSGSVYTWEFRVKIFADNYVLGGNNTPVTLSNGKIMGFSIAYNDNDGSSSRENMIGSGVINLADKNVGYKTADYYQELSLVNSFSGQAIPGKIEAENWTNMFGVQTEPTNDIGGGLNVGWTDPGDWIDYNVNIAQDGTYKVDFKLAVNVSNAQFQIKYGSTVLATVNPINTNGWQNWQTFSANVNLTTSMKTLRLAVVNGGFNINWMDFKTTYTPVLTSIAVTPPSADVVNTKTQQFTAQAYDQFNSPMSAPITWSVSGGGTIDQSGLFSATTEGNGFVVRATSGSIFGLATVNVTPNNSDYTMVWSDEFNGSIGPDWVYDIGGGKWGNNELQYYRSENASIVNNMLQITAKKESFGGYNYTSARLKTHGKKSWKYGKMEALIKVPNVKGLLPAFWMLGDNIGPAPWPSCGEIDIMEEVGTSSTNYGTIHWDSNGHAQYGGNTGTTANVFHLFSIEWDESAIKWFVDGVQFHEANIKDYINSTHELHNNMFILLNVAVGGDWPGFVIDDNSLPMNLLIDYVRVYQKNVPVKKITSLSITPNPASVDAGSTVQLTPVILPTDATNKTLDWSSSDITVATVDGNGNVTGVKAGSVTISAKTKDGSNITATCSVTINPVSDNLAKGKSVFVSTSESASYPGTNAVDGNHSTRWSSQFGDPQWIYVDLRAVYNINRVKIVWENAYGKNYNIQVTNTPSIESSWVSLKTIQNNTTLTNDHTNLTGSGQYVRIYGTARGTNYGYSIYELEVYGSQGNQVPVVNAGPDQILPSGTTCTSLNGTATDPDNGPSPMTYSWLQVSGPIAIISNTTILNPSVCNLADGNSYTFQLVANDGVSSSVADQVVIAVNSVVKYTLTTAANGTGSGTISINPANGPYDPNTAVTLTANPAAGSVFAGWSGDATGSNSQVIITMDRNKFVTATFNTQSNSKLIEAESYVLTGGGCGGNGVQKENTNDVGGGQNIGWIDNCDWVTYDGVNLAAGTYSVDIRYAGNGGQLQFEKAGGTVKYGTVVTIPSTSGWQDWRTLTINLTISESTPNLGVSFSKGGFNLNWYKFTQTGALKSQIEPTFVSEIKYESFDVYPVPFNKVINLKSNANFISATLIDFSGRTIKRVMAAHEKFEYQIATDNLKSGIYFLRIETSEGFISKKLVK